MKIELSSPTRLGIQAAIAVILAEIIGHYSGLERSYWAVLTSVMLISQTWGDSIQKALHRVGMTIAGGCTGTFLYYYIQSSPPLVTICLLASIFFIVYFLQVSYLISVFFITCLVVFLFAELQGWNTHLLEARIIETIIGALIAIVTSAVIFPIRAQDHSKEKLAGFFKSCTNILIECFQYLENWQDEYAHILKDHYQQLAKEFTQLQQIFRSSRYENLFSRASFNQFNQLNFSFYLVYHYLTSIIETAPMVAKIPQLKMIMSELKELANTLENNLNLTAQIIFEEKITLSWLDPEPLRQQIKDKINANLSSSEERSHWFNLYSFLYFCRRFHELLSELIDNNASAEINAETTDKKLDETIQS